MKDVDQGQAATIRRLVAARAAEPGALLPILPAIQDEVGFIPEDAAAIVADVLNLSMGSCIRNRNAIDFHETTADRKFSLEPSKP